MADPYDFFSEFLKYSPFPEGHPHRRLFEDFASSAAEKQARMSARFTQRSIDAATDAEVLVVTVDATCELYDFWAQIVAVAVTYETIPAAMEWLEDLVRWTSHTVLETCPRQYREGLQAQIPMRLVQRKLHWIAECHRSARARAHRAADASPAAADRVQPDSVTATHESAERGKARRAVVEPLLADRGLTKAKWAAVAGVDSSVVYDYLAGSSQPRPESRNALAGALQIPAAQLPE